MSEATPHPLGGPDPQVEPGPQRRPRGRAAMVAGGVAAALALGGGATWAANAGVIGGGSTQPEDVLPSGAMAFAKVDLDPGVAQKVGAFRLFDKIPDAKKALSDNDPKKALFELARRDSTDLQKIDYAKDIEPWLGDRAGVAVLSPEGQGGEPVPVLALAVKDEAKAKEALDRVGGAGQASLATAKSQASSAFGAGTSSASGSGGKPATAFKDGYVLVASQKDKAKVDAAVAGSTLKTDATFSQDMEAIGETGVASGWVDSGKLTRYVNRASGGAADASSKELEPLSEGRTSFALRFAPDHLEVAQVSRGMKVGVNNAPALKEVRNLPGDTAAFMSFSGGSDYLGQVWPILMKAATASDKNAEAEMQKFERQSGLAIPEDIQTVLGKQLDVVVGKQEFAKADAQSAKVGARLWTDTTKVQSILEKVNKLISSAASSQGSGSEKVPGITMKPNGEHLDVALEGSYRDQLSSGGLGSAPAFATVLPDIDKAAGAGYLDLDAIESTYLDLVPAGERDLVRSLQAVGVTVEPLVDGQQRSTLRLSVN